MDGQYGAENEETRLRLRDATHDEKGGGGGGSDTKIQSDGRARQRRWKGRLGDGVPTDRVREGRRKKKKSIGKTGRNHRREKVWIRVRARLAEGYRGTLARRKTRARARARG